MQQFEYLDEGNVPEIFLKIRNFENEPWFVNKYNNVKKIFYNDTDNMRAIKEVWEPITYIRDNIYLGGVNRQRSPHDPFSSPIQHPTDTSISPHGYVVSHGITSVVSVTDANILWQYQPIRLKNGSIVKINSLNYYFPDDDQIAIYDIFDKIADFIMENAIIHKRKLFIHCRAGISRSATLLTAFYLKYSNMSLEEILTMIRSKRPYVRPNDMFLKQLIVYEMEMKMRRRKNHK
jgi:protein-tyrosine phosphatase